MREKNKHERIPLLVKWGIVDIVGVEYDRPARKQTVILSEKQQRIVSIASLFICIILWELVNYIGHLNIKSGSLYSLILFSITYIPTHFILTKIISKSKSEANP